MWVSRTISIALIAGAGVMDAYGYVIDKASCKAGDIEFLRAAINAAFANISLMKEKVIDQDIDGDTDWLIGQLFLFRGNSRADRQSEMRQILEPLVVERSQRTDEGKEIKWGLLSIAAEKELPEDYNYDDLPSYEVVIYCNTDRILPGNGEVDDLGNKYKYYDHVSKMGHDSSPTKNCLTSFMFTNTRERPDYIGHDTITICSWFLREQAPWKFKTLKDIAQALPKLAAKGLEKLVAHEVYTPVDATAMFEKMFLHEFTHTEVAYKPRTDIRHWGGYGWKNCKRIAAANNKFERPEENAETWALFGHGLWLHKQKRFFNADGTFKASVETSSGPGRPGNKRDLWLGSGAGRAIEDVQDKAVQRFM